MQQQMQLFQNYKKIQKIVKSDKEVQQVGTIASNGDGEVENDIRSYKKLVKKEL